MGEGSKFKCKFLFLFQTSENRKGLLDEMAISMQVKADESAKVIADLRKELEEAKNEVADYLDKYETALSAAEEAKKSEESLRKSSAVVKERAQEIKSTMEKMRAEHEEELKRLTELGKDELNILKQESDMVTRDLRTQLEISNAQRSEFEESIAHLDQEMRDRTEEARIGEKKTAALLKDLKRQLKHEKQGNEKLQEKMRECSFSAEATAGTCTIIN